MKKKPLVEMSHARVSAQKKRMAECQRLNVCPLCWENLEEWHNAPVIKKGKFWVITENDYPYKGSLHHYLAIYKEHISSIAELKKGASEELFSLFSRFCAEKKIEGASILLRFGEMDYTGASISHLHAHIISGASKKKIENSVKFPDSFIISVLGYKTPE
ncbi:MAG: hypothetical protein GX627_02245 [Parcubacteria group bacterium]|jgi:diadenosine tetraphosphate (Ap4A) HIT family hydrolase|nr:hypothetical protein [Parcubacteria group bacterium]